MSSRRDRGHAAGLGLSLLAILTWSAPALSRPQGAASGADDYFRQGKSLVREGKLEEAQRAYLAGYRLRKGYDIAGNLGSVELELGKPRDAAEHLAFCLKNFPATGTAKQLEFIQGRLKQARREVSALSIAVSVDGAEILVDGRSIGRSPLPDEVFVDPGSRTLEARLRGYEPARRVIEAGRGASVEVALEPRPLPLAPPPAAGMVRGAPPSRPASKSPVALYAALSGAAVGVGMGVGVAALAASNESAATAAPRSEALFRTLSVLGFATAGAASIATIMFVLLPGETPGQVGLRARVSVAPGSASFGLLGRF
jgi:hypothetical protein